MTATPFEVSWSYERSQQQQSETERDAPNIELPPMNLGQTASDNPSHGQRVGQMDSGMSSNLNGARATAYEMSNSLSQRALDLTGTADLQQQRLSQYGQRIAGSEFTSLAEGLRERPTSRPGGGSLLHQTDRGLSVPARNSAARLLERTQLFGEPSRDNVAEQLRRLDEAIESMNQPSINVAGSVDPSSSRSRPFPTEDESEEWDRLSSDQRSQLMDYERHCMTPSELRLISRVNARHASSLDIIEVLARRRFHSQRSNSQVATTSSQTNDGSLVVDLTPTRPVQQQLSGAPRAPATGTDEIEQHAADGLRRSASIRRSGFRVGANGPSRLQRTASTTSLSSQLSRRPASMEGLSEAGETGVGPSVHPSSAREFEDFAERHRRATRRNTEMTDQTDAEERLGSSSVTSGLAPGIQDESRPFRRRQAEINDDYGMGQHTEVPQQSSRRRSREEFETEPMTVHEFLLSSRV